MRSPGQIHQAGIGWVKHMERQRKMNLERQRKWELQRKGICPECKGSGRGLIFRCFYCDGTGRYY